LIRSRFTSRLQFGGAPPSRWWVVGSFDLGEKNEGWETRYIGEPNVNVNAR
jgi:hypothetical protein